MKVVFLFAMDFPLTLLDNQKLMQVYIVLSLLLMPEWDVQINIPFITSKF